MSRARWLPLVILSALAVLGAAPQPPSTGTGPDLPDTPAGRRAADFLAAFNSGSLDAIREFIAGNYAKSALEQRPVETRFATFREISSSLGALELARVEPGDGRSISLLVRSTASGEWLRLTLELEPAAPHGLTGLRIEEAGPPGEEGDAADGGGPLTAAQAIAALEAHVDELAAADAFSGVVLVARDGAPVWSKAWGLADRAFQVPNRVDTRFNLGSINKVFTKVAIGQLAERGKLGLGDRLIQHLPDYPNREVAEKVTIGQLVDHTSGLGDFFNQRYVETPKDRLRTTQDFLALFVDEPLLFTPGSEQRYSNAGYVVLGAVIEKLSGQDYHGYVRDHVFAPAGMKDTDAYEADVPVPNLAQGYTRGGRDGTGPLRSNVYSRPARGSSAGGGYSTAEDLLRFSRALTGGKLLGPGYTAWILGAPAPAPGAPASAERPGGAGFAGGAPGINAVVEIDPERGFTLVVLANGDPPAAQRVGRTARGLLARIAG